MTVIIIIAASLALIVLSASFIVYRRFFYTPVKHQNDIEYMNENYPYAVKLRDMTEHMVSLPCEMVYITSRDGLKLEGRFYPSEKENAPVAILAHGYRGVGVIDMSGGAPLMMEALFNVLVISERGCMGSEGHTVTFGIKETSDLLEWVKYVQKRMGENTPLYLMGISMGAHTVLNCADKTGSANVRGIIADCPYTSSRAIVDKVLASAHFVPSLMGWFVNFTTALWGGFLLSRKGAVEAVKNSTVPVLLIHGTGDKLVPFRMSEEIRASSPERVTLVAVADAPHAQSFLYDREKYTKAVKDFIAATE